MEPSKFADTFAENVALACVFKYGRDAYVDVSELLEPEYFSLERNQVFFEIAREHFDSGEDRRLDIATAIQVSKRKGFDTFFGRKEIQEHFGYLNQLDVDLESARPNAAKILKLRIAHGIDQKLAECRRRLHKVSGDESRDEILSIVENEIFNYIGTLSGDEQATKHISGGLDQWIDHVEENPRDNIGIPTPYPKYNASIGGGFRRGGISIMAARPKCGKSLNLCQIGLHVAGNLGIPVLNIDTEMQDVGHWPRILSNLTGIETGRIEKGNLSKSEWGRVREKAAWLKTIPFYYRSVLDETFEEQVSAMRRWIIKDVGKDENGVRNNCLVLYDYLQLTDPREFGGSNKFAEYQILGFQMVALSRIAKRYDVPILSMLQLNKEGWASGSDRIVWKCDSFTKLERKDQVEMARDGKEEGNAKLTVEASRYGPGSEKGDYINLKMDLATARVAEGKTFFEMDAKRQRSDQKGLDMDIDPDERFDFGEPLPRP